MHLAKLELVWMITKDKFFSSRRKQIRLDFNYSLDIQVKMALELEPNYDDKTLAVKLID